MAAALQTTTSLWTPTPSTNRWGASGSVVHINPCTKLASAAEGFARQPDSSIVPLIRTLCGPVKSCALLQIVICSACSGHGYKFCSVMGEVLADLATTGSTRHDIEFLRINSRRPGMKELTEALHGESTRMKPPSAAYKTSKL